MDAPIIDALLFETPVKVTAQNATAEELLNMPDDGYRYELVKGQLRRMSPGGSEHGAVVINLTLPLAQHVKANSQGVVFGAETGFLLATNPDTVRAPDIAFVRRERIPATGLPEKFWPGPPDLAVEVLSPGDTVFEVDQKVEDWLSAGTGAVWVVNPKRRTVAVHRQNEPARTLTENDILDGGTILPGFSCSVAGIFA